MSSERPQPATPPYRPLSLFAYTVEASAPLYRAIMHLFLESKERYRIQLRTDEVAAELARATGESPDRAVLDRALDQLHAWGNLRRSHDTGRVATLEDFRRRHFVYQLTPAGEAAERAVGRVIEALESSGSLQRVMLGAILRSLKALAEEARAAEPRPALLYEHLFIVAEQFRSLTENAGTFLARLHEAIDAGEVDTTAFLIYKQAVLEYLEQFVGELAERTPEIAAAIREIDAGGAARVLALAAEADATPTPEGRRDRSAELERQWRGIGAWFVGDGLEPPTVEHLRGAARAAINRILLVLERLHEKRFRRVDRTADLLRLAGWFESWGASPPTRATTGSIASSPRPSACSAPATWGEPTRIRTRSPPGRAGGRRRRYRWRRCCAARAAPWPSGARPGWWTTTRRSASSRSATAASARRGPPRSSASPTAARSSWRRSTPCRAASSTSSSPSSTACSRPAPMPTACAAPRAATACSSSASRSPSGGAGRASGCPGGGSTCPPTCSR